MNSSDAIRLIQDLRKKGLSFWTDAAGNLVVRPAGLLTPARRALLKTHKPAVVARLQRYVAEWCPSDEDMRRRGWLKRDRP